MDCDVRAMSNRPQIGHSPGSTARFEARPNPRLGSGANVRQAEKELAPGFCPIAGAPSSGSGSGIRLQGARTIPIASSGERKASNGLRTATSANPKLTTATRTPDSPVQIVVPCDASPPAVKPSKVP